MSKHSLSKTSSKLNLTRRQIELFQKMILIGNQMSEALSALDRKGLVPKNSAKLARKWGDLMVQLVKMLI